jgi:uncharacterized protein (DUF4415 family)
MRIMAVRKPGGTMAMRLTKSERIARTKLLRHLWAARTDQLDDELEREAPAAWHTLEADLDVEEPKVKVTLYLDTSVARMFQAMGKGYQARINRVLGTWMQMKIAGLLQEREEIERRFGAIMARDAEMGDDAPGFSLAGHCEDT